MRAKIQEKVAKSGLSFLGGQDCEMGQRAEGLALGGLGAKLEETAAGLVSRRTLGELPGMAAVFPVV